MARDRENANRYDRERKKRLKLTEPHRIVGSREWAVKNPERHLFRRMRISCEKSNGRLKRPLTFEEFIHEIGGRVPDTCPILGIPMSLTFDRGSDGIPTVDRIDSSKSYEIGNIAIISWKANRIKNSGTADEHRRISEWMDRQVKGGPP